MQTKRECHLASYEEYSQRANIEIKETKHWLGSSKKLKTFWKVKESLTFENP